MSSGYVLHPKAFADLDDIRDYIAQENPDAADGVMAEIFETIRGLWFLFAFKAARIPTSVRSLYDSLLYVMSDCLCTGRKTYACGSSR
jgi:hypothetical protein